jgi:tetratricopeptide (TPR) repeat protein
MMNVRKPRPLLLCLLVLLVALSACQKASKEHLAEARQALAAASFDEALASAEAGLGGDPDPVTQWGLELVVLEANARAGHGEAARGQLIELVTAYPERISATDYSGTAQLLQAADQKPAAIEVLDLGIKRYPEDAVLARMIQDSVATGSDPAELEMLRSLGYIE